MGAVLHTAEQVTQDAVSALAAATDTGVVADRADAGPAYRRVQPAGLGAHGCGARAGCGIPRRNPRRAGRRSGPFVPVQLCPLAHDGTAASGTHELLFVATHVPALGTRVIARQVPKPQRVTGSRWTHKPTRWITAVLRLRVHRASGAIEQLLDHAAQRDVAGPWAGWGPEAKVNAGMLNRLQILWEQPHPMSAWNIGDITRVENLLSGADVRVDRVRPGSAVSSRSSGSSSVRA